MLERAFASESLGDEQRMRCTTGEPDDSAVLNTLFRDNGQARWLRITQ